MPRIRPLLAFGLAAALAAGCAASIRPEVVQSWVGRPAAALQQEWGPPTREAQDGDLRILIYEEVTRQTARTFQTTAVPRAVSGTGHLEAQEAYRLPTVYVRSYVFWVTPVGTVVRAIIREP